MTKPVLYTFPRSVWSAAPHLALAELGIDAEFKIVDLVEGANFDPEFLKLNPNATLPTLTHDGESYTSTTAVIDHLVSISSVEVAAETSITKTVHEDKIDPNFAFLAARNEEELAEVSGGFGNVFTTTRLGGLKKYAATEEGQAYKTFYDAKIAATGRMHALLNGHATHGDKQGHFTASTDLWAAIKAFTLETLPAAITVGPFIGGARPGVDDFHVGAWLARIAFLVGAQKSEEGFLMLDERFGLVDEKVETYLKAWSARDSWVKTYPDHVLH
ncbi:hypothetical protein BJV78DRAFT_1204333 [Lactifluus subvellereus]|nr:hypothetical protein BJV78DRAFT_1204333 [Lactifluus subvellereus]